MKRAIFIVFALVALGFLPTVALAQSVCELTDDTGKKYTLGGPACYAYTLLAAKVQALEARVVAVETNSYPAGEAIEDRKKYINRLRLVEAQVRSLVEVPHKQPLPQ